MGYKEEQMKLQMEKEQRMNKLVKFGVIGVVGLVMLAVFSPFTFVGTGERGVVTHFGKVQEEVLDEGIHFTLPIVTSVHKISVRVQKSDLKSQASSKDLQLVTSEVAVNWHIEPSHVNDLYQTIGDEDSVVDRILGPSVSEVFKATTAKKTAEEIITRRNELADETQSMLRERLAKYGVILDEISIVDLDFTKEFSHAVEQKQVAEQQAKQAEYVAMKATADAKAAVNTAKGQAEAALTLAKAKAEAQKLLRTNVTPELLQQQAIEKWDGTLPNVLGSGSLPFLNMSFGTKKENK